MFVALQYRGHLLAQDRSIPSLDGLRAISVLLVILGHSDTAWSGHSGDFLYPLRDGHLGVATFFVISGFLITNLLLRELNKAGEISLRRFYIRRAFRIFPPCYVYLAVIGILSLARITPVDLGSFLSATTYTWNYNIHAQGNVLGHLWSLSLEEQFYLLWPACLVLFRKATCLRIAIVAVCLSPISRLAVYFLQPEWRGHTGMMLHTRIDTIMIGCILALVLDLQLWSGFLRRITRLDVVLAAAAFVLFVNHPLIDRFKGGYELALGITLQSICCGILVLFATSHSQNPLGKILNHPVLRHIGMISYSLYLWQQLFTFHERFSAFPWNVIIIFACAELSYFLVEKPSFYLRDKVLTFWAKEKRTTAVA
jgi:peptidoglycan/LPS O-acetylase OafA/YrhL